MITCCKGCRPPKRNGYCHTYCDEYTQQKDRHDAQKAVLDKERNASAAIYSDRGKKVARAMKKRRSYKK